MTLLALDTATSATTVALLRDGVEPLEVRDDPKAGERPRHTSELLALAASLLERGGLGFADVDRIAVGVGPGSFTGLRVGLATARALALATDAEIAGVSTLRALALPALQTAPDGVVLGVIDARRGEAFVAAWQGGRAVWSPRAEPPARVAELAREGLAATPGTWLGVGDGAVRFRTDLEGTGVTVPPDRSPLHRVSAVAVGRLGLDAEPVGRDALLPDYVRAPDAAR